VIGSLRGVLLDRTAKAGAAELVVEVGGVGYRVTVPPATAAALGELGSQVFVHVHTHVREDAIVLFGFGSRDERRCFEALIGAHGVGPAVALAILSVHTPAALSRILARDDADALTLVPGIGKKTAARLLIELKTRLDIDLDSEPFLAGAAVGAHGIGDADGNGSGGGAAARAEVRAALASLGYSNDEIRDAMGPLPDEGDVSDLLKQALRGLAGARLA
jgi:Holliday junction DNA helicase RuvA